MVSVRIEDKLKAECPQMVLGQIECDIENTKHSDLLWIEIEDFISSLNNSSSIEEINSQPQIKITREVYKRTGKDPNRYRPSAEQLRRRVLQGKGLYKINTLVDLINLISLETGYSIGGFDVDKIVGDITAGIGNKDEKYEGIGRGLLNIEGLPVLRDSIGGIGTPTSDEERTALSIDTKHFLMIINAYSGREKVLPVFENSAERLRKFVNAQNIKINIVE